MYSLLQSTHSNDNTATQHIGNTTWVGCQVVSGKCEWNSTVLESGCPKQCLTNAAYYMYIVNGRNCMLTAVFLNQDVILGNVHTVAFCIWFITDVCTVSLLHFCTVLPALLLQFQSIAVIFFTE